MKSLFVLLVFVLLRLRATAENAIPSELVGEWRPENTKGEVSFQVRADGFCVMMGIVGVAGVASYNPRDLTLTMSIRHERTGVELRKLPLRYNLEVQALILKTEDKQVTMKRHSTEISEQLRSFDLKKLLEPSR